MNTYSIFHQHSYYSNLDGLSSPDENCRRAKELNINLISITDHGNVNGHLDHIKAAKKYGIKYALGVELYVPWEFAGAKENRANDHLVVWAKSKSGLKQLWKMVGLSNHADYFYYKPRIQLRNHKEGFGIEEFAKSGELISYSGHQGSKLANLAFIDPKDPLDKRKADLKRAYRNSKDIKSFDYYTQFLHKNWLDHTAEAALEFEKVFGKGNFYIEIQNEFDERDELPFHIHNLIAQCMREVSKVTGIPAMASSDSHYARREQSKDQRILLLTNMKSTEEDMRRKMEDPEENDILGFFSSDCFYIKSYEEMKQKFTQEELNNTNIVADQIEQYSLEEKAKLPTFSIPSFKPTNYKNVKTKSDDYLLSLAIDGAKKLKPWNNTGLTKDDYWERLKTECDVIFEVGLSDYFLIVQDICKYCENAPEDRNYFDWQENLKTKKYTIKPIVTGPGRGSAAGCLLSYLTGITKIDPLMYGLIFSRFYNKGRNKGGYVSYPDIDLDIQATERPTVLNYLKWKYQNTSQIITFSLMKGRGSLKDVFRVKNSPLPIPKINEICDKVGIESKIIAEIEEMKSEDEDYNSLKWTLDNIDSFQEYYKDPHIKEVVDQAIRVEGTVRGTSKHASGVLIYPTPISDSFPTCLDPKSKETLVSVSMSNLEKLGGIKVDCLAVSVMDRLKMCEDLVHESV